jgi:hypothetical protein
MRVTVGVCSLDRGAMLDQTLSSAKTFTLIYSEEIRYTGRSYIRQNPWSTFLNANSNEVECLAGFSSERPNHGRE